MGNDNKDALTDVVQNLPDMASGNNDKPAGTVVSSNGERVTLGEEGRSNASSSSPQQGMNKRK
jgi:hypothetical protein